MALELLPPASFRNPRLRRCGYVTVFILANHTPASNLKIRFEVSHVKGLTQGKSTGVHRHSISTGFLAPVRVPYARPAVPNLFIVHDRVVHRRLESERLDVQSPDRCEQ